jgi:cardiolipin synthase
VVRIGNAVGAAFANRRVLHPVEERLIFIAGLLLLGMAVLFYFFPRIAAYPLIAILGWIAIALMYRAYKLHRERRMR